MSIINWSNCVLVNILQKSSSFIPYKSCAGYHVLDIKKYIKNSVMAKKYQKFIPRFAKFVH